MRDKNKKLTIVVLAIAVVSLTIGFAAFSSSLNISSSATVAPNSSNFSVRLSNSKTSYESGNLPNSPTIVGNVTAPIGFNVAGAAFMVAASGGASASIGFVEPGASVTYTLYVRNDGKYTAYLNEIIFDDADASNVDGSTSFKVCITSGSTLSLMNEACKAISATVTISNGTKTETATNATKSGISGFTLAPGSSADVTIKFEYASNGARADGPFNVYFGNIKFNFSTVD